MQSKSSDLRVHAAEEGESLAARIVHCLLRYFAHRKKTAQAVGGATYYCLGANEPHGIGGGNRNDRKSATDCSRLAVWEEWVS